MSKMFYPKLAGSNIKKNGKFYFPYIVTCTLSISMYFLINLLANSKSIGKIYGGDQIQTILQLGMGVAAVFFFIFIFYTNSFLIKRRKKQFGLFSVLGMENKHLHLVNLFETFYVYFISLAGGFIIGTVMSKLIVLILKKFLKIHTSITIDFEIKPYLATAGLFGLIFLCILIKNIIQISRNKTIDLLKGQNSGEKEPKTKWILTLIGIATLGAGYIISIRTKSPMDALNLFIFAVILVIIGTYCLFTAGSIAFLKILKKKKNYYYSVKHFSSVSGMIYRMKQNAVGLGNICIICTAILVMISTTVALKADSDDTLNNRFPRNVTIVSDCADSDYIDSLPDVIKPVTDKYNIKQNDLLILKNRTYFSKQDGNKFIPADKNNTTTDINKLAALRFITLEDFNRQTGNKSKLEENQCFVYEANGSIGSKTLDINKKKVNIIKHPDNFKLETTDITCFYNYYTIVVKDIDTMNKLTENYLPVRPNIKYTDNKFSYEFMFNTDLENVNAEKLADDLRNSITPDDDSAINVSTKKEAKKQYDILFGGMLFLGVFLGFVFMIAAVLIIYYKQISEGYDDKERFKIMQQVGMSQNEVKKTIHSQIISVFFLPIITACIHLGFALPIISRMLKSLGFVNNKILIIVSIICCILLFLLYSLVYWATSKVYYKIVK